MKKLLDEHHGSKPRHTSRHVDFAMCVVGSELQSFGGLP